MSLHIREFGFQDLGNSFYVESGILGLGIRNEAAGIRNPTNNWNPKSGIQVPEVPMKEIWNPVIGIQNPRCAIQNPRLSWIPLCGATSEVESKILKCEFIIFIKLRSVKRTTARRLREFILLYFILFYFFTELCRELCLNFSCHIQSEQH